MELIWLLDRSSGLIAYSTLFISVFTGIFYNSKQFGILYQASQKIHIEISVFSIIVMFIHSILGFIDTWMVVSGQTPEPNYGSLYLFIGSLVGFGGLWLILIAVLGFIDAKRFDRPWTPRIVHMFSYGGFIFVTIHSAAIGTDLINLIKPILVSCIVFIIYALILRGIMSKDIVKN